MNRPSLRIFDFTDYREYLSRYYREAKALDRRFSHRFIMEKVGAASSGWFSDLVSGRINLTGSHLDRLAQLIGLGRHETDYFASMVDFAQAASLEEKTRHLGKLMSFKEVRTDLVGRDKFAYYSRWHHAVIRELLFVFDFRGDFRELGKKLNPPIGAREAKQSVELLKRLELVAADESGRLRPTVPVLRKDAGQPAPNLASFLRANMQLGMEALERVGKDERDISSLSLALSEEDFRKAREEIKALRKKLLAWSEKNNPGARVYQCNFQVFPVTR